jgi:predicted transposase YdaD
MKTTPQPEARYLLQRNIAEQPASQAIIEMITTIMVYKFEQLSQQEVEVILGITLKETRVYQEIKEEWLEHGLEQGREEEAINLVIRLLNKRFGVVSGDTLSSISGLTLSEVENLIEALLDFTSLTDLQTWLANR